MRFFLSFFAVSLAATGQIYADTVTLTPTKDNTIYSESGSLSNGAGWYIFAGNTAANNARRCLLAFDVAGAIPAGSTIVRAELRLYMSRTIVGDVTVRLHRVLADWGEGTSDAFGQEGAGAPATQGDATWTHRFYDTILWSQPGGDFVPTPSAQTTVGASLGFYSWGSTPEMVADVQAWLDNPASNFGWIVIGDENLYPTAKRFNSRQHTNASLRPQLIVDYIPPLTVVPPTSFQMIRGLVLSGDLNSVLASDDNYLKLRPWIVLSGAEAPIQIVFEGTSPVQTPSQLRFAIESQTNVTNVERRVFLYNFVTNQWDDMGSSPSGPGDTVLEVTVPSNPERYVESGTRRLRALVWFKPTGLVLFYPWQAWIDHIFWRVGS